MESSIGMVGKVRTRRVKGRTNSAETKDRRGGAVASRFDGPGQTSQPKVHTMESESKLGSQPLLFLMALNVVAAVI